MNRAKTTGFTIIELMLAMTFIAALLVSIAMVTIQISLTYNKGVTLRAVDRAGQAISSDIQRTIAASAPFNATKYTISGTTNPAARYVVTADGRGGRLCTGQYTYAWNQGDTNPYNRYTGGDRTIVRFVKVRDSAAVLCQQPATMITKADATEMLASGDRNLVVHDVSVTAGASDAALNQAMYAVALQIGTIDGTKIATLGPNDYGCVEPSASNLGDDYCAVDKFDIVARAGNQ